MRAASPLGRDFFFLVRASFKTYGLFEVNWENGRGAFVLLFSFTSFAFAGLADFACRFAFHSTGRH